jgi:Baseplate J-like protein
MGLDNITKMKSSMSSAVWIGNASNLRKWVTLFSVFSEGALQSHQENQPLLDIGDRDDGSRWSWAVTTVEGFKGAPRFWVTHPQQGRTSAGRLHFTGVELEDWEFGRLGKVVVECRSVNGARVNLIVNVAVRSIDMKDLTFYSPATEYEIRSCAAGEWGDFDFTLTPPSDEEGHYQFPVEQLVGTGDHLKIQLADDGAIFSEARDSYLDLTISSMDSKSKFRLRVASRPLMVESTGLFPCKEQLRFVKGEPIELSIEGEPSSPNGFTWSLEEVDFSSFKLAPSFAQLTRGSSAVLILEDTSEWDWINGTGTERGLPGSADLVIRDGRRPAARLPITFGLQKSTRRFNLAEGTKVLGPDGEKLEIAEDGEYEPVITSEGADTRITLEGVPVRASEKGASGNLPGGSILSFDEDQSLLGDLTVYPDGLTQGADYEAEDKLRDRVRVLWADPPAHGNRGHVLQIIWQVEGVDRAFVYPPFALDGMNGLGKVGCALVAPGHRSGVGKASSLAGEVRKALTAQGSLTADYVIMDVDDRGEEDPSTGKGACQVDVELQIRLTDEVDWGWSAAQNLVVSGMPDPEILEVYYDPIDPEMRDQVVEALGSIAEGDLLYLLGQQMTVQTVDLPKFSILLAAPIADENGEQLTADEVIGARIYPPCPVQAQVDAALESIFGQLGTSEAPARGGELAWQRRYPLTTFLYPDELRVAEITNQLMDIDGIEDIRLVTPEDNVLPPPLEAETLPSGDRAYTTYILSLRRVSLGPLRPTPGYDSGYAGPEA